ncbi:hypothetical protein HN371_11810 [Candidatus Poribacteria bacterium]|jgi:ankyrin repeat protein|nr:hypothetical protein [Candidatus Poribacteria bacterium]MBT5532749.1 hypothetical protein [Candidatus Poribacteria bacterium]MBT5709660.1 hypothetical protein [Candidatus Poribacteria bacterium]MBT7099101.1 hypothetical protein [Candidatus Poribacteria bacterium]MBT7804319.1 hypothetical protein [Candidatus Poribacteria bacterium]
MPARSNLPARPNLEHLKNQAKDLRSSHSSGGLESIPRLRAHLPRLSDASDATVLAAKFSLLDAQLVVAREYGFDNWMALQRHVERAAPLAAGENLAPLIRAVKAADAPTVAAMLAEDSALARARIYDADLASDGNTLLHLADAGWSDSGELTTDAHLEVARLLLDHGADIHAQGGAENTVGESPLGAAAWAGNLRMCQLLLDHGADANYVTPKGFDALGTATDHGRAAIVEAMMRAGATVEPRHLLQLSIGARSVDDGTGRRFKQRFVEALDRQPHKLHQYIDIGHFDGVLGTLLHVATIENLEEMAALLLERGAHIDARDSGGSTALHWGLQNRRRHSQSGMVDLLLDCGAQVDIRAAAALGDVQRAIAILDDEPSQIQRRLYAGYTPLHTAVEYDQPEIVALLLERGADVEAISNPSTDYPGGKTPLALANDNEREDCAQLLREAGATR